MNKFVTWITTNDTNMFQFINQQLRCRAFDFILPKITHAGGATFNLTTLLVLLIASDSLVRGWVIEALLSLTISHIIVHMIKKASCRERPYNKLTNVHLGSHPLKDYSFPSGHTAAAFSIAVVFALHSFVLAILLLPVAFLVAVSRMYLGLHFPTDCFIGALLGTVVSLTVVYCSSLFL